MCLTECLFWLEIVKETESAMESVTVMEQQQETDQPNYKVSGSEHYIQD